MPARPMGPETAEMTAVAEATREAPAPTGEADLVLIPAARLAVLSDALAAAAALPAVWEDTATHTAHEAGWWLLGARARGWADALDGAAAELRDAVRAASHAATSTAASPPPRRQARTAAIDAVHAVIKRHEEMSPQRRATHGSRLPFETAQAAIDAVAPAAHDAALQRARGLLLDHGHREAAALLATLASTATKPEQAR